jgi:hypothetical protein
MFTILSIMPGKLKRCNILANPDVLYVPNEHSPMDRLHLYRVPNKELEAFLYSLKNIKVIKSVNFLPNICLRAQACLLQPCC